jgi:hypothetical protein
VTPAAAQVLSPGDAAATVVRIRFEKTDAVVELALDGRRARPLAVLPASPTLADLAENAPLAPGEHFVVAALRSDADSPALFAITRFFVGRSEQAAGPIVYCGRPAGTYYGAPAEGLLLDFAVDGFALGRDGSVRVIAFDQRKADVRRQARLTDAVARRVRGITPSDWTVELALLDQRGEPLTTPFAKGLCELTVNEVQSP